MQKRKPGNRRCKSLAYTGRKMRARDCKNEAAVVYYIGKETARRSPQGV